MEASSSSNVVLEAHALSKTYVQGRWWQKQFICHAVTNVSLTLRVGETLALIGKSGSGKTSVAMCLVGLEEPDAGEIVIDGSNVKNLNKIEKNHAQRKIQLIFQDSARALNPRMTAIEIVEEPLLIQGRLSQLTRQTMATEMIERVGISPKWKGRRPHEFSGGQRQRLAIARALLLKPKVLILDEVFVGLDASIRGAIANLLLDLQQGLGLSYMFISHDFALVRQLAETVSVMHRGEIIEMGTPNELAKHLGAIGSPPLAHKRCCASSSGT